MYKQLASDPRASPVPVLVAGGYLIAYLAGDLAALDHLLGGVAGDPWNPAPALSLSLVARMGGRWTPLTLLAPLVAATVDGRLAMAPGVAFLEALAEAAVCSAAALYLRREGNVRQTLERLRGLLAFFMVIAVAGLAYGLARMSIAGIEGAGDGALPARIGLRSFLAFVVAAAMVTPLFLARFSRLWRAARRRPSIEILLQAVALGVTAWEVLGRFGNEEVHFFYLLFLPCAWIATRHGQRGSAYALAATFAATMLADRLVIHHDQAVLELHIRMVALAATSLLLGVMAGERQAAESQIQARQVELARLQRLNVGHEMASALAHELNQPLTAAMNYTQAGLRILRMPSPDLARVQEIMGKSVDRIEQVGQIISGLRDFMRKGEPHVASATIEDIVDDALELVWAEANAAGVAVRTSGLAGLAPVLVDKTQIAQVLVNLLRNATQSISAAAPGEGLIQVSGWREGDSVRITVADNGPGVPPEVMARLFEPFVTTKDAGMGLGLSISKSIVESHGGRLWAENGQGGGALFHLELPMVTEE
jgi:signal transduction histidine kinase